jgi:ATP-dependent helicase HepA
MSSNPIEHRSLPASRHVGSFVRTSALGTGRLIYVGEEIARVQYFTAPGRTPYVEREHLPQEVTPVTLSAHTRAYFHDAKRWHIGRIDGVHPGDPRKYLIALPNGKGVQLPVESFDVRWGLSITNPYDVLETVGGDSPIVYETRLNLLRSWFAQRAAITNVEGLVLGSVELHRHQLDVVRRVGADPIKRYLLADEVGLGKTIEASALIWQFLKEHPDGRILILAPDHLREQWQSELLNRFRTDHYPRAWIRIRAHTDESSWPDEPVGLLVIDEAHHVTRTGTLPPTARKRVAELAHSAQALLLLSATPVRSNEAGFLDLLWLVDPDHYRPDQLHEFSRRVELRDRLALTYQGLTPEIDEFDLSLYADELNRLFPEDHSLRELLAQATSADDPTRPDSVLRVREHLSETYRLHHRLLRTRRTSTLGQTFSVRGRKRAIPFTLEVDDPSDIRRSELLDSLRIHLVAAIEDGEVGEQHAVRIFREVAQRCGSLSFAMIPVARKSEVENPSLRAFHGLVDRGVLPGWQDEIEQIHDRHRRVLDDLGELLSNATVAHGGQKAIIVSAFTETAQAVAAELVRRWGSDRVATHMVDRTRAENVAQLARWHGEGPCSLLVCDAGAEEGINLQQADLLIHVDLPWEAFRVEQRIGRCDRHSEARLGPVPSQLVVYGDQPYSLAWIEFLADGCGIFGRSVSSLQYVLADTEQAIEAVVLREGPQGLSDAVQAQTERLNTELATVVAHDALDSIQKPDWAGDETADDTLLLSDERPDLATAIVSWLQSVGAEVRTIGPGAIQVDRKPRLQIPFGLEYQITPYMETPLALKRTTAVERLVPILRAGHPLVEALGSHLRDSDRGVTFAMFRQAPGQWPPVVVLRTDFLVTATVDNPFVAAASSLGLGKWARQMVDETMPPVVETVLMTIDGKEVPVKSLLRSYDKRSDQNLASRPDLFDRLTEHLDWTSVCGTALERSQALLRRRWSVKDRPPEAASTLRRRVTQRADRAHSRRLAGVTDIEVDLRQLELSVPGVLEPMVSVLGCGVMFLGDATRIR